VERQSSKIPAKEPVISSSDAVTEPRTVVVEILHTVIANGTVGTPWWAIEFTCTAPLHLDGHVVDVNIFVQRHEIIFDHVFRRYSWEDTGIHCGSSNEVNHGKDEDDDVRECEPPESIILLDVQ